MFELFDTSPFNQAACGVRGLFRCLHLAPFGYLIAGKDQIIFVVSLHYPAEPVKITAAVDGSSSIYYR
jgi:hypothetical protein